MDPNSQTGSKISSVGVSKSTKAELKAIFQKYYQDA